MKKIISLVLILAMALCLFAGCDQQPAGNPTEADPTLADAKEYLYAMYKDNSEVTAVNYNVVGVVTIDGVAFDVTWASDLDGMNIVAGNKIYTVELPAATAEEVTYTLTATIKDAAGNTDTLSFTYKIPAAAGTAATLADGTYVILFNNLTMSSLTQDKSYGYPYATEVTVSGTTVSGHVAADVLTIKNVEGGVTIQDAYGRYFYLKGTYNSFNVDATAPAEGHIWEVLKNGDNYLLVNAMNKKTLAYSTSYTSWGAYPELTDDHNSLLTILPATAPEGGSTGTTPEPDPAPSDAQLPEVTAPVEGTAYKFGMIQVKNGHTVYVTGAVEGRYLSVTTDKAAAADVYVEAADGGYKFYILVDGVKNYIEIYNNDEGKRSLHYNAENGTVFTFNAECSIWTTNFDGKDCYMGSYNTFDTISVSDNSYINAGNSGISQFPAGFFAA